MSRIAPMEDDIVYLGDETHTYVSEVSEHDETRGLWEIIDYEGVAYIVTFVRERKAPWGDFRYEWTTIGVDNTAFGQ